MHKHLESKLTSLDTINIHLTFNLLYLYICTYITDQGHIISIYLVTSYDHHFNIYWSQYVSYFSLLYLIEFVHQSHHYFCSLIAFSIHSNFIFSICATENFASCNLDKIIMKAYHSLLTNPIFFDS